MTNPTETHLIASATLTMDFWISNDYSKTEAFEIWRNQSTAGQKVIEAVCALYGINS